MTQPIAPYGDLAYFLDLHPDLGDFKTDVIKGLSLDQKALSPKYFYDEAGSKLFDEITTLEEYYPTRTEKELFNSVGREIAEAIGSKAAVFEYGSGSSEKIEWLVKDLSSPVAYVAMDISKEHLIASATTLASVLPVPVGAICADFNNAMTLPEIGFPKPAQWLGYFPGSTIGNMAPSAAALFLERASKTLGKNAKFLLGVDLVKDKNVLEAAYDDKNGVTAAFNLNLLRRMKSELDAYLTLGDFEHFATFNEQESRIEMHLRAIRPTTISLDSREFSFREGETLHTENSYKYSVSSLKALIDQTPWTINHVWTDPKGWYAACLLSNN